jgi:transposase
LRAQLRAAEVALQAKDDALQAKEVALQAKEVALQAKEIALQEEKDARAAEQIMHAETVELLAATKQEMVELLAAAKQEIVVYRLQIEKLQLRLDKFLRKQFGASSERLTEEMQGLLFSVEDFEIAVAYNQSLLDTAANAAAKAAGLEKAPAKASKTKPRRKPLPDDIPYQDVHYPAPGGESCTICGSAMRHVSDDVSETLEIIPRQLVRLRHIRPKFVCSCPDCSHFDQAPAPSRVIERSYAGASLLSHVAISKFVDHLPLYRQAMIFKRSGIDISRSTMADWMGRVAWEIQPVIDAMARHVLASPKIHGDDTIIKVLEPGSNKTKTGRLWVHVRDNRSWNGKDPPAVFFKYSPDRKSEHPLAHLQDYGGYLQADAYAGYNKLYDAQRKPAPVIAVGCWAHARRELFAIAKADPHSVAVLGVQMIKQLYAIEDRARGQSLEVRRALREEARPIVIQFYEWVNATLARISSKSKLGEALGYFINQRETLARYLDDARLEIDNNIAENAIRTVALGRKNFLFAGADVGGERAAGFYSLMGTCKLNGVNPEEYLTDILRRIADGFPNSRIDELLPWNWKQGTGYRYESGLLPEGQDERAKNGLFTDFRYAELNLPHNGVREGLVGVSAGDFGLRVRSDIDAEVMLFPADVDVQLPGSDDWIRAGFIKRLPDGSLVCELRFFETEIIRFRLVREPDGKYTSWARRGDLLSSAEP